MTTTPTNPLREGLRLPRTPESCAVVVFGATGDLTARKLVPALYNLARERVLPGGFSVVGFARRDWTDESFRAFMKEAVAEHSREPINEELWDSFARGLHYVRGSFDDLSAYVTLGERLGKQDASHGAAGNRLFYLATPPRSYIEITTRLGEAGLVRGGREGGWSRVVIEKPYGQDLATARELDQAIGLVFRERQIYRIDHYLGKETVQNILVFRFANGIFEPLWNRRYVDNVQVSVAETVGVEGRGGYYEEAGALRDMVQNHLLQVLSLIAMEPMASLRGDAVRDEKAKLFQALRPIEDVERETMRAQYTAGAILGVQVPGYRQEDGVAPASSTETFVAMKLNIDNWRWAGVPFYLRVGKRLPKRATEVAITFKKAPLHLFHGAAGEEPAPNLLVLRIQPDEGISLRFGAKVPGTRADVRPVSMDFRYGSSFGVEAPEAYERLLLDAMLGDPTLFTRWDSVEAAWALLTPVLDAWRDGASRLQVYEAGTWGPRQADELIERGRGSMAPDVTALERIEEHPSAVDAGAIEDEFARIWRESTSASEEGAAVRVRVMNLVAVGTSATHAERFEEVLQTLPKRHPCRAVFGVAAAPYTALSATISARCWRDATTRRHLCSEEVVLTGAKGQDQQVASAVLGLLVPDLPVALWLLGEPAASDELAPRLLDACDSMIVDSARGSSLAATYAAISRFREAHEVPCFDQAWARLAPWRELIAQMFDGAAGARELDQVNEIIITGGSAGAPSSEAALIGGWLASRLAFTLADATVSADAITATLYDGTRSVLVRITPGSSALDAISLRTSDAQFEVARHADSRHLHVREVWDSGATSRIVDQPAHDEGSLIALTLDGLGELATYQDALVMAESMVGS